MSGIMNMLVAAKTTIAAAIDAYFNNTTLLLNTSSTNGAQNNTFLDSSTNNFTITRNGNTTQGTFTPFSQTGWSNFFDGSSNLQTPSTSAFNVGTGNFTFEAWIFPTAITANTLFFVAYGGGGSNGIGIGFQSTGLWGIVQAGIAWGLTSSTLPTVNQWNHVVACRGGTGTNQTALFLNGTRIATGTYSTNFSATSTYGIGWDGSNTKFSGYMSNLRFNTTDVYGYTNSTITVPTTNLSAITGTAILTCQSNRFLDNSTNAFSLTINGTPSVQAFSPFAPTAAYSTSVVGGSGYFDGTGDYLVTPSDAAFNLSSGDWTIEGWLWLNTNTDDTRFFSVVNSSTDMYGCYVRSKTVYFGKIGVGEASFGTVNLNAWNHIAFCKTSTSTITCYINGVSTGTTTSYTLPNANCTVYIAATPANYALSTTNGYISNFRIVKGTAVYTSTFTPPTAPLTAISNTQLLLSATNSGIYDSTAKNVLETVGNAQVSTTQAKWGTTAIYFDGSGDYLYTPNPCLPNTGDFTLEMWIYPTSTAGYQLVYSQYTSGSSGGNFELLWDEFNEKFNVNFRGSTLLTSSSTYSLNAWHHLAIVRSGSTFTMYVDGASAATATNSDSILQTASYIGTRSLFDSYFAGYIDDIRITRGYARYSGSTYTVPAAAFPLQ